MHCDLWHIVTRRIKGRPLGRCQSFSASVIRAGECVSIFWFYEVHSPSCIGFVFQKGCLYNTYSRSLFFQAHLYQLSPLELPTVINIVTHECAMHCTSKLLFNKKMCENILEWLLMWRICFVVNGGKYFPPNVSSEFRAGDTSLQTGPWTKRGQNRDVTLIYINA